MNGIECKNGHVFSMCVDSESNSPEWKLEQAYYKAQGCELVKNDYLVFSKHEDFCSHCNSLEHEFETLIEQIKKQ